MSSTPIPLATLAPPPPPPVEPTGPALPPPPDTLRDGGAALGPLPPAPFLVRQKPRRFLIAGIVPLGIALVLTLVSQFFAWPGTPEAALATAQKAIAATAQSGQPVWYLAPGVTAPVPITPWPTIRNVPGYPNHKADVVVRFLVGIDGTVDRTGLTVSGPGSGPVRNVTALLYSQMRFRPGRVGNGAAPVVMEHRFHYPM